MTVLRDERLRLALAAAPDADLPPLPRTRAAIRAAAHAAVTPAWRRWWPRGGAALPWNAALATVLLASLITLLWQGREVPGVRDEAADQPAPPARSAPAPAAPQPVAVPPVDSAGRDAAAQPQAAPPAPAAVARVAPPPLAKAKANAVEEPVKPAAPSAIKETETPRAPLAAGASAQSAPAPAPAPALSPSPAAPSALSSAPAAGLAAPPGRTESQARAAAPAAPALRDRAAARPDGPSWDRLRVDLGGSVVDLPRAQAGQLPGLLARALQAPSAVAAAEVAAGPAAEAVAATALRLVLREGDQVLGTLELAAGGWRWLDGGGAVRDLRLPADLSEALQAEARRMVAR